MGRFASMFGAWVDLERKVSDEAAKLRAKDKLRVYEWRPVKLPELPALWNWIDDGAEVNVVDTQRDDDIVIITATLGVLPADLEESMGRLVRLLDVFIDTVDPALRQRPVLPDKNGTSTARAARRIITRSSFDNFNDTPVMCMDMMIRVQLPKVFDQ